ncbi:MAG TPA: HIT family protein [Bacteroidales bacterium]
MGKNPDCLYCTRNQLQQDLMIEICDLSVSTLFLFKEQTYYGRCVVAYKGHANQLFELSDADRNAFMADVARVAKVLTTTFNPVKINMGAYSDKLQHLHFHLAPKYVDGPDYGGTFQMNPQKVYLSELAYTEVITKIKAAL